MVGWFDLGLDFGFDFGNFGDLENLGDGVYESSILKESCDECECLSIGLPSKTPLSINNSFTLILSSRSSSSCFSTP